MLRSGKRRRWSEYVVLVGGILVSTVQIAAAEAEETFDWPNWRGPQQNRISTETGLVESWDPEGGEGSNLLWKSEALAGRGTPIVLGSRLYTIVRDQRESKKEGEKVVCADAATGKILWEYRFNVYLSDVPDSRIGWSSCVADPETGRIYAQGVCGYFCCLEGDTGELVWSRSLHEEYGLISTYGGRTNFPIVFEDTVLISAVVVGWGDSPQWDNLAKPAHRYMAFDKETGELRWMAGTRISPYDTTYSTPSVARLGDQAALVFGSGDGGIWALQPRTGKPIWNFPMALRGISISPVVTPDGRVYMSHSEENTDASSMGMLVALDGTLRGNLEGNETWAEYGVMAGKSSPLLVDGRLYVVEDSARLWIIDAATGERIASKALGAAMRGSPLYADGKIYLCTRGGRWYTFEPTETGVKTLFQMHLLDDQVDGSPIVSRGRIFLPTAAAMYCIGKRDASPQSDPLPTDPLDELVAVDSTPAHVQLVPYDTLLVPGGEQNYRVRLYNVTGDFLREVPAGEVTYSVEGPGSVSAEGTYTALQNNGHECARVVCQVGDLTGSARVRVVPPLPWYFDFDEVDDVPLTWIGGRVRYVVTDLDDERLILKRSVLPTPRNPENKLGTRSRLFMGPIDLSDYTIQSDVQLTEHNGRLPDVGIVNSRYTLSLRGQNSQLRLFSWGSSDFRQFAAVDFNSQPDVWYTLKLSVVPEGDQATVRGKVWRRDQSEPESWTIEMIDPMPNLHGSPGLYGNSQEAEIYLDNIRVVPN